jgi:glycerol kinase
MVRNQLLMRFHTDILGVPVVCPHATYATTLDAAYAAGRAVGY